MPCEIETALLWLQLSTVPLVSIYRCSPTEASILTFGEFPKWVLSLLLYVLMRASGYSRGCADRTWNPMAILTQVMQHTHAEKFLDDKVEELTFQLLVHPSTHPSILTACLTDY